VTDPNFRRRRSPLGWPASLGAALGAALSVTALAGTLLAGASVPASLRDLARASLGRTAFVVRAPDFVAESFVSRLRALPGFQPYDACPLIAIDGFLTTSQTAARHARATVYGVGGEFWTFQGLQASVPRANEADVSVALAQDLGVSAGDVVEVRIEKPPVVPPESLMGRKDDMARGVRLTIRRVVGPDDLGEFSLQPRQAPVRAIFLSLSRLQRALDRQHQINVVLVAFATGRTAPPPADPDATLTTLARQAITLEDVGLETTLDDHTIVVEDTSGRLDDREADAGREAARDLGTTAEPVLAYVANGLRAGDRFVPYSSVAALDLDTVAPGLELRAAELPAVPSADPNDQPIEMDPPIVLNGWTARILQVNAGATVWLSYYLPETEGALRTEMARFRVAGVVQIDGIAADRRLVPPWPGIARADSMDGWDPPFPVDRNQIGPLDEEYWRRYGLTPKAFVPLDVGERLWGTRGGRLTSLRVAIGERNPSQALADYRVRLRERLPPVSLGIVVDPARDHERRTSDAIGATVDLVSTAGLLVLSTLGIAALLVRVDAECRARAIGVQRTAGLTPGEVRRRIVRAMSAPLFAGATAGLAGALFFARLLVRDLDTIWSGAVGTRAIAFHVAPVPLLAGGFAATAATIGAIALAIGPVARCSTDRLLAGRTLPRPADRPPPSLLGPLACWLAALALGAGLVIAAFAFPGGAGLAFRAAGPTALVGSVAYLAFWLRRRDHHLIGGSGWEAAMHLGVRSAAFRPGRSVVAFALVASGSFAIVGANAFRRTVDPSSLERDGGTGGYPLVGESVVPVPYDLNTVTGRKASGVDLPAGLPLSAARFTRLLVRPGDDVSQLSLLAPVEPRVLGVGKDLITSDRFAFDRTIEGTPEEQTHPWRLLERELPDGAVPVIADTASMRARLGLNVGEEMTILDGRGSPTTLRFVASLHDSVFQHAVLMSDRNFRTLFPDRQGFQMFLIDVEPRWAPALAVRLRAALSDYGFTVVPTTRQLESFARASNTRIGMFQMLSAWALLIGMAGLAALLVWNACDRRREIAWLRVLGFSSPTLAVMMTAENTFLAGWGLAAGVGSGLLTLAPAFVGFGAALPDARVFAWLAGALIVGVAVSLAASLFAVRMHSIDALAGPDTPPRSD
jgi:putative ABC transport system permease protein